MHSSYVLNNESPFSLQFTVCLWLYSLAILWQILPGVHCYCTSEWK